jgi:hypothetical protein
MAFSLKMTLTQLWITQIRGLEANGILRVTIALYLSVMIIIWAVLLVGIAVMIMTGIKPGELI